MKTLKIILGTVLLSGLVMSNAQASTSTSTFNFSLNNVGIPGSLGHVDMTSTGSGVDFSVVPQQGISILDEQKFYFNVLNDDTSFSSTNIINLPTDWSAKVDFNKQTADGFGKFDVELTHKGGWASSPLTFSTNVGNINTFTAFSQGGNSAIFAAHVNPLELPNGRTDSGFVAAVPEAEEWAMMMLGLGMMGLVSKRKQTLAA